MRKRLHRSHTRPIVAIVYHRNQEHTSTYRSISQKRDYVDADTSIIIESIKRGLRAGGYGTRTVPLSDGDLSGLSRLNAQFVFNLVDSRTMEIQVASALERMRIPYSGSDTKALKTSNNKVRMKRLFRKYRIPTPDYRIFSRVHRIAKEMLPGPFPLIVKPAFDHCSIGISDKSVVTGVRMLAQRVRYLLRSLSQPVLVERFIPGRELQILVTEQEGQVAAHPVAEMKPKGRVKNRWNIYGFGEKWYEHSTRYNNTLFVSPAAGIPERISRAMRRDALRAFFTLGFRDYARFDLRYDPETERYYFLEGNANPGMSIDPADAFMASLRADRISFSQFLRMRVENGTPLLQ